MERGKKPGKRCGATRSWKFDRPKAVRCIEAAGSGRRGRRGNSPRRCASLRDGDHAADGWHEALSDCSSDQRPPPPDEPLCSPPCCGPASGGSEEARRRGVWDGTGDWDEGKLPQGEDRREPERRVAVFTDKKDAVSGTRHRSFLFERELAYIILPPPPPWPSPLSPHLPLSLWWRART